MTTGHVTRRRFFAAAIAAALALTAVPATMTTAALDPELTATLELRDGFIDYQLEPGTLHFFDEENQPLAVQVIDGCAVNDHYWLFGAGLSGLSLTLSVTDETTGKETRVVLPPFEPGMPIGTVFDPEALDICGDDVQVGGLPPIDALARYTSADDRDPDITTELRLLSDGSETAYRRLSQAGETYRVISRRPPIAAVDESGELDRLFLIIEGRVPRSVEGIVFTGDEGMLPARAELTAIVEGLPKSRVRRAYEIAENGREPNALIGDLGLRKVQRIHHLDLDFETLGSDAYLAIAGWIREGGKPIEPPSLVEDRFVVELARADGSRTRLPLTGPFVGSDAAGSRWEYAGPEARVQIADNCRLTGSYWTWAVARTEEPLELVVTDTASGDSVAQLLWTDRSDVSSLADSAALDFCP
jgi:hypothetical protein